MRKGLPRNTYRIFASASGVKTVSLLSPQNSYSPDFLPQKKEMATVLY